MGRVYIGKLARPHGVKGELRLHEGTGSAGSWKKSREIFVGASPEEAGSFMLLGVRTSGKWVIVSLDGVDDFDKAKRLQGQCVYVDRQWLGDPGEDYYYLDDLLGLRVFDMHGSDLGTIKDIFDNGAHEVYIIANALHEIMVPIVDGVVQEIDLDADRIVINPPEGLLDVYRSNSSKKGKSS